MVHTNQKGAIRRLVDAVKAGVRAFRESAPLQEPARAAAKHDTARQSSFPEELKTLGRETVAARLDEAHHPFLKPADASLFLAITAGDAQAVRAAVQCGADLSAEHRYIPEHRSKDCIMTEPVTPLGYALRIGNEEIIRLLWGFRAKGSGKDETISDKPDTASEQRTIGKFEMPPAGTWAEAGPVLRNLEIVSPVDADLVRAIGAGDANAVLNAVLGGADLKILVPYLPKHRLHNCAQLDFVTPLAYAIKTGNLEIVNLLKEMGAKE